MAVADLSSYEINVPYTGQLSEVQSAVKIFNDTKTIDYTRITPKKTRQIEIKQYIARPIKVEFQGENLILKVDIIITKTGSIKPSEVLHILHENFNLDINEDKAHIHRTKLTGGGKNLLEC